MKLRPFELALLIVFGVLGMVALFLLSNYDSDDGDKNQVAVRNSVEIWGTLNEDLMNKLIRDYADINEDFEKVFYKQIDPRNFDFEVINAIADGRQPDILFISHERLIELRDKIYSVSYDDWPERDFRNSYIDGAEVFALDDGIYGFPVMVNPLMMYWNRDMFSTAGLITPPTTWEQIVSETVPSLVQRSFNRSIIKSPIAFGTFNNVKNAYGVLSTLLLQGGSRMTYIKDEDYVVSLTSSMYDNSNPFYNAMDFYTKFGSISNPLYSWNRTLPEDKDMFISEDLSLYFGFASEAKELEEKNPNLNFDMAEVPNGRDATVRRVYGRFYSFVLLKSGNLNDSFTVASTLGSENLAKTFADAFNMAPVYRSSLIGGSKDIYGQVYYKSAQVARGWLNPDLDRVESILSDTIDDIHANRKSVSGSINDARDLIRESY